MDVSTVPYRIYRAVLWFWDLITLNAVLFFVWSVLDRVDIKEVDNYIHFFYFFNVAWLISVYWTTLYLSKHWLSFEIFLKNTARSFFITSLIVLGFIFLLKYDFSRFFVLGCLALFGLMLLVNRLFFLFLVHSAKSRFNKRVVILGNNEVSRKLISYFNKQSQFVTVVGCFYDSEENQVLDDIPAHQPIWQKDGHGTQANYFKSGNFTVVNKEQASIEDSSIMLNKEFKRLEKFRSYRNQNKEQFETPVLGSISDCLEFVMQNEITEIYSTISPDQDPAMYDLALKAEDNVVHFKFVLDMDLFLKRRFHVDFIENLPVLSLRTEPLEDVGNRIRKRLLDIGVSLFVIVFILSWLIPMLAILIKLESNGPVFFLQQRSGRRNKSFWCMKFRSLRVNGESDSKQVTRNDGRITRIGRFIRKTNIDELPQFFNVLAGHMSLVGPRPHMLKHTEEFHTMYKEYMIRHFVKPGITGLAQVSGFRGEIRSPELLKGRIEKDIYYMENWSLWFDIKLMLATIAVTFRGDKNAF